MARPRLTFDENLYCFRRINEERQAKVARYIAEEIVAEEIGRTRNAVRNRYKNADYTALFILLFADVNDFWRQGRVREYMALHREFLAKED